MPTIETTAEGLPALIAARLAADTERLRRVALEVAQQSLADVVRETNAAKAVDRGFFKLSWRARPYKNGAIVENTAPYAAVLEYGRRPGRPGPPLAPIYEWVQRKFRGAERGNYRAAKAIALGLSRNKGQRMAVRRAFGREEGALNARLWGIAMAIRDKIHFRGTPPKRILRAAVGKIGARFRVAAMREMRRRA